MTQPQPVPVPAQARLEWQIAEGVGPTGVKFCVLVLKQGALVAQVQLSPIDLGRMAADMDRVSKQASSGLILPVPNGQPH